MTRDKQKELFDAFTKKQWAIMNSKAEDYANDDRLSNFKKVGSMCGTSPEQAILHLIATKVARLGELFAGKTPNNESTADSIIDLANYSILLHMVQEEQNSLFCKQVDINKDSLLAKYAKIEPKLPELSPFTDFLRARQQGTPVPAHLQLSGRPEGKCSPKSVIMPKAEVPKKKKVKTYKAADGVKTFKAKNMKDALKQLEALGIKVPNGMMLGCMQVK